jgi:hypothetical protein
VTIRVNTEQAAAGAVAKEAAAKEAPAPANKAKRAAENKAATK